MGWSNGPRTWKELHRALSDEPRSDGRARNVPVGADGDSPAWSRKRQPYQAPTARIGLRDATHVPYAELHCHSAFSFLDGASHPEKLAEVIMRLYTKRGLRGPSAHEDRAHEAVLATR